MKTCQTCNKEKPFSEFQTNGWYKKTRKYKPSCKPCSALEHRRALNTLIEEFFGGWKCMKCGFEGIPAQYDCHHRNPEEKEFQISRVPAKAVNSKEKVMKELEKCDLLCANCHRLEHTFDKRTK